MGDRVASHYSENRALADLIAQSLQSAGKDLKGLTTADLATVDEFHIRGRKATLELAAQMKLDAGSHVLDIGSGLGGPARTLAQTYGCRVTGLDLTQAFCDAAVAMSAWAGLGERTAFKQGDATKLPFADRHFDAAMTIHVAMNIAAKDRMYAEARRVLKPGGIFALYDVLQGEGGDLLFPGPVGARALDQPSGDARANEIAAERRRFPASRRSRLDRRKPEFLRENDRADGANGQAAGGLAAVSGRRFPGHGAKPGAQCTGAAHQDGHFHLRGMIAKGF